jgi:phosphatidylinositol kinase/protein kinase (PI-3  family)
MDHLTGISVSHIAMIFEERHQLNYTSANWDCVSVIVKTGGDLRQEQLAVQLIREFQGIWAEERCSCWVK